MTLAEFIVACECIRMTCEKCSHGEKALVAADGTFCHEAEKDSLFEVACTATKIRQKYGITAQELVGEHREDQLQPRYKF